MGAPEVIETERLLLRKPRRIDAESIFQRYAGDPEVTKYLSWPTHHSVQDTLEYLDFSDAEWARKEAGPYLIISRMDGNLLGSTGLELETATRAATGYVLAKDAQHRGYATEMLTAISETARTMGIVRLYAVCHPENAPSWHLLERCGFVFEGLLLKHTVFPNLGDGGLGDVMSYVRIL